MDLLRWKKQFLNLNLGVSKITIADALHPNCIQKKQSQNSDHSPDERLNRILKVQKLGNEVNEALKPNMVFFEQLSPIQYQDHLANLIKILQGLRQKEKRQSVRLIYQDAIRVLQSESLSSNLLEEFRIMLLQG